MLYSTSISVRDVKAQQWSPLPEYNRPRFWPDRDAALRYYNASITYYETMGCDRIESWHTTLPHSESYFARYEIVRDDNTHVIYSIIMQGA